MTIRDSFICNTPIAHRGLHENVPENSRAAFEKAIEAGYAIETDVRRTKDGTLVVIHDDNLKRLTGESGKVSDIPYRELSKMRLLGTDEKVMTLDEWFRICWPESTRQRNLRLPMKRLGMPVLRPKIMSTESTACG